ncbi:MAG: hypothetical protein HZA04_03995 [Nitrospinae bacterium]|nr:hypothetical protein [Nitrospinota bacterium]
MLAFGVGHHRRDHACGLRVQHHEHTGDRRNAGKSGIAGAAKIKLLISVISPEECAAFSRWPDCLDVKNPAAGALGMAEVEEIHAIRAVAKTTLSVAIGDADNNPEMYAARAVLAARAGADIVKVGLLSFTPSTAVAFLSFLRHALEAEKCSAKLVAGVYADLVDESFLRSFPHTARTAGIWGCLIDTFSKNGEKLGDWLGPETLSRFTADCRSRGLVSALAGGLDERDLAWLDEVEPDYAGFRSAVAKNGRGEKGIDPEKLERLLTRKSHLN